MLATISLSVPRRAAPSIRIYGKFKHVLVLGDILTVQKGMSSGDTIGHLRKILGRPWKLSTKRWAWNPQTRRDDPSWDHFLNTLYDVFYFSSYLTFLLPLYSCVFDSWVHVGCDFRSVTSGSLSIWIVPSLMGRSDGWIDTAAKQVGTVYVLISSCGSLCYNLVAFLRFICFCFDVALFGDWVGVTYNN
jgi:hypothetical protein